MQYVARAILYWLSCVMTTTTTTTMMMMMVTIIMKYFYSTKSVSVLKNVRMKNVGLLRPENQLVGTILSK